MVFIPRQTRNGALLRRQIVERAGVLQTCLHFLWDTVPPCALELEEGTALNTNDPEIAAFLSLPALPYVLQGLRACLSGDQDSECLSQSSDYQSRQPGRPAVTADRLLHLFHLLETSKSAGRVGLLAEDMLTEWCPSKQTVGSRFKHQALVDSPPRSGTMASVIQSLRKSTSLRTRRLALNMRQRQLRSLNMRVDEKGQVAVIESDRLAKMTSALTEETGLACAICLEGFRNAPQEALGVYVYVRQCPLEQQLCYEAEPDKVSTTFPVPIPKGYSTLSNFVVVHFSCHANSVRSSPENQWVVAQRHNRDARCNSILPILGPPTNSSTATPEGKSKPKREQHPSAETVYAEHLANFMDYIMRTLNVSPGYVMALHDVKSLLTRFACNRQFHLEIGGGGRESNLQLLPHLIQVGLHSLLMSSSVNQKLNELTEFLNTSTFDWSSSNRCWNSSGPLYYIVAALHLWPRQTWLRNRLSMLLRLIQMACGRIKHMGLSAVQDPDSRFLNFKPYLIFFALVDACYEYLFKDVQCTVTDSTSSSNWCSALSQYISTSDEAILKAVPRLLTFYQDELLSISNVDAFADVTGLMTEIQANELASSMDLPSV
ncbi:unnamed protein product [Dicrocoelium dendriticum]|nr:unnamed protein product [Dicrocoelium dendriticum]